ncbi:protein kinase [Sphaerisporangium sp. B11E5]|uniref:serine/threonine-protein kinase n=1 Tax=Sphaerisporangium sp. B11E5 TaxID=3153563 RepID=UPI00325F658D
MNTDPASLPTLPPGGAHGPDPGATPIPLGRGYRLERLIGQGSNGRVYEGRRLADGHPVAIKVLREEYAADHEAVARFLRERAALRSLDHPHLVPVHDLVVEGDTHAIVMELVTGETLRDAMTRGAFDPDRVMTLLGQVAAALAAVHAAGIVHRDLKPENVLVTWRGGEPWTRLTDFGVALVADGQLLTRLSQLVGTPAYLAPELAQGRPAGTPVDVYALGVMAYELLAGHRPFSGDNPMALLRAHLEDEPSRPDGTNDEVWRVLSSCLAKRPEDRPRADVLAESLTRLRGRTGALPTGAPPPIPPATGAPAHQSGSPAHQSGSLTHQAGSPAHQSGAPAHQAAASVLPGGPLPGAVPSQGAEALATSGATVLVPEAPAAAPPARRGRLVPVLGVLGLLAVAVGGGLWYSMSSSRDAAPAATASPGAPSGPATQWYSVPVVLTSPERGTIKIDFADASSVPGFVSYVVLRGNRRIAQPSADEAPPYVVRGLDGRTRHCYRVMVLVESSRPVPVGQEPACRAADGRAARQP